ncbi:DegT/DnrJ/EryC1/StrS family aminotransferase, partial [Helicobacter sp.]|uniref:DegT/DnrJ/EryC1/StrS family aminotransferase n=1 Tax=Helicobacter sp. TaxID=218 RepID=UPI002A90F292
KNREAVMTHLKQKGIEYGLHYPIALPNCPAFNHQPYVVESPTPNASVWQEEILSLPMGEHLSDEEVKEVVEAVKDAVCG